MVERYLGDEKSFKNFTEKQGQYLAYIYIYQQLHGRATLEADMQDFFKGSPPSVHRMVVELEKKVSLAGYLGPLEPFNY